MDGVFRVLAVCIVQGVQVKSKRSEPILLQIQNDQTVADSNFKTDSVPSVL